MRFRFLERFSKESGYGKVVINRKILIEIVKRKRKQMIKLIATDVDGTLVVDGSGTLNPEYFPVIEALIQKGIVFIVASGRAESSIENIMKPIVNDIIMIAEGGSYVSFQGKELESHPIDMEIVRELIKDIHSIEGCEVMINGTKCCYTDAKDEKFLQWIIEDYHFNVIQVEDLLQVDEEIVKVSLYHATDATKMAKPWFLPKWEKRLHVASAGKEWIDCVMPGTNKGVALKKIQEQYGISKEETMVFGDNINDLEMLAQAKYSFAVANAREEVKEQANYRTDSNKNHGVLKVLKQLLAGEPFYN